MKIFFYNQHEKNGTVDLLKLKFIPSLATHNDSKSGLKQRNLFSVNTLFWQLSKRCRNRTIAFEKTRTYKSDKCDKMTNGKL